MPAAPLASAGEVVASVDAAAAAELEVDEVVVVPALDAVFGSVELDEVDVVPDVAVTGIPEPITVGVGVLLFLNLSADADAGVEADAEWVRSPPPGCCCCCLYSAISFCLWTISALVS